MQQNNFDQDQINNINQIVNENLSRHSTDYNNDKENVSAVIKYVLSQPIEFIKMYVNNFVQDCLNAYITGDNKMSCIKGQYERIYTTFRDVITIFCTAEIETRNISSSNKACKPEYLELFDTFYNMDLNDILKMWFEEMGDEGEKHPEITKEQREEHFRNFIKSKLGENNYNILLPKINKYINENTVMIQNVSYGGRKSRKGIKMQSKRKKNRCVKGKTAKKRRSKRKTVRRRWSKHGYLSRKQNIYM